CRNRLTRRRFLQGVAASAGGLVVSGKATARPMGANERIRIAIAGIHGRGHDEHIPQYKSMDGCEIVYLVDPDTRLFDSRVKKATKHGRTPKAVQDIRRVLDDKNVDVVSVATPNHWHSLITIWACQA